MVSQLNIQNDEQIADTLMGTAQASATSNTPEHADSTQMALALRVSSALQTTLDLSHLIKLFAQQIKPALPHDGIRYENIANSQVIKYGKKQDNICKYRLSINESPLGEITLTRSWPFTEQECKVFEYTLCSLVYPLRNALSYLNAIQAAHRDSLTGIYNRATFNDTLSREIKVARRYNRPLTLLVIDIDHFKGVNDKYGHSAGDTVIKSVVEHTAMCIRGTDILFRYGGEEFVVLLSNTNIVGATQIAERIRSRIETSHTTAGNAKLQVTVSIGAGALELGESEDAFFTRTDNALYRAKNQGRNQVCIAAPAASPPV